MTINGARHTAHRTAAATEGATVGSRDMTAPHAARRLTKTERLARELMERRESIPQPLLAALLITLVEEAERRKDERRG